MVPRESGRKIRKHRKYRKFWRLETRVGGCLVLLGLIVVVLLAIGAGMIRKNREPVSVAAPPVTAPPDPMEPAALAALEQFFEVPDTASKAKLVHHPERVRPMMEDYHDRRGHPYPTLGRVSPGRAAHFPNVTCVLFEIEPFTGPHYPAAVIWDGKRFAVDWESLTAYGTMDWIEFTESRPASPQTLRVFVTRIQDAQKTPGLPAGTSQFAIEHRDDPQPLVAVADAAVTGTINPLTEDLRSPVTLEMAWKPIGPGGAPVACISRVIATGWSQ